MRFLILIFLLMAAPAVSAQKLSIKPRSARAAEGSVFAKQILDTTMTPENRENLIYQQVVSGNIPDFYRKLVPIRDTLGGHFIEYYVIPDFLAIGSNSDYFYCPMTAALAQRVAKALKCNLVTRKISDDIYRNATVKMIPEPIPPTPQMITVPVFLKHSAMVQQQRQSSSARFPLGSLVAGNKKDVVVSNKIFNDKGQLRVVIYGWHRENGKAIQPLYNGHKPDWVDYSHGIRLIQNKVRVDGKSSTVAKVLNSADLHRLLSDEGSIQQTFYP